MDTQHLVHLVLWQLHRDVPQCGQQLWQIERKDLREKMFIFPPFFRRADPERRLVRPKAEEHNGKQLVWPSNLDD